MKKTVTLFSAAILFAASACFLAACNSTTTTTSVAGTDSVALKLARNKATVMASEEAFIKKDPDGVLKNVAPGFTDYASGEGKPATNIDSIKTELKEMFNALPDYKGENLKLLASGDTVIVTGTWSGTFKNEYHGTKPNGKAIKFDDVEIFVLDKDGKIVSRRSTQSEATVYFQLGFLVEAKK